MAKAFFRAAVRIGSAVCLASGLAACSLLPVEEEELKPPLVEPVKEKLNVVQVKRGTIVRQVSGVATFSADRMDYLYFRESGKLASINVKPGDRVKAGDVVASMETEDLVTQIRLQEINVEKIKISLEQEKASKGANDPSVRLRQLDLESAQIQLQSLRGKLERRRLVATMSGIVTFVENVEPGQDVAAFRRIVTIADPNDVKLIYTAGNQSDLAGVEVNMEATVKIKDKTYKGKVVQTPLSAPQSANAAVQDRNSKSIIIEVEGLPPDVSIGSQADITVVTEKRDNVLIIPRAGLRSYMGRDYVQILDGESRREVDVEKGIVTATEVEIRKGLEEGQQIVLPS